MEDICKRTNMREKGVNKVGGLSNYVIMKEMEKYGKEATSE